MRKCTTEVSRLKAVTERAMAGGWGAVMGGVQVV